MAGEKELEQAVLSADSWVEKKESAWAVGSALGEVMSLELHWDISQQAAS